MTPRCNECLLARESLSCKFCVKHTQLVWQKRVKSEPVRCLGHRRGYGARLGHLARWGGTIGARSPAAYQPGPYLSRAPSYHQPGPVAFLNLLHKLSWRKICLGKFGNNPQPVQPCGHGPYGPSLITACAVDKWVKLGQMAVEALGLLTWPEANRPPSIHSYSW